MFIVINRQKNALEVSPGYLRKDITIVLSILQYYSSGTSEIKRPFDITDWQKGSSSKYTKKIKEQTLGSR